MLSDIDFYKYISTPSGVSEKDCFEVFNVDDHEMKHACDIDITRILSGSTFLGIETDSMEDSEYNELLTVYLKTDAGEIYTLDMVAGKAPNGEPNVTLKYCQLKGR